MKHILHLGLHNSAPTPGTHVVHMPIIHIVPIDPADPTIQKAFKNLHLYTHIIFTSQSAVSLFYKYAAYYKIPTEQFAYKIYVAVGSKTANQLKTYNFSSILVAKTETAEGVIEALKECDLKNAYFFWPHSALSRPLIKEWLKNSTFHHHTSIFYTTESNPNFPKPDLAAFDEIVFTSPSTIDAFLSFYGTFPPHSKLQCIGPITQQHLNSAIRVAKFAPFVQNVN